MLFRQTRIFGQHKVKLLVQLIYCPPGVEDLKMLSDFRVNVHQIC